MYAQDFFVWERDKWLAIVIAILIALSTVGLSLGFASHGDYRAILERSVPAILHGHYVPGRSYGNPLYELAAATLYPLGGLTLLNCYSLALAIASVAIFAHLLTAWAGESRWALAAFALNPFFLIHAVSPTEWSQATVLLVGALAFLQSWMHKRQAWKLIAYGATISAMVLTRPDFAIFCAAMFAAAVWELNLERTPSVSLTVSTALAALFSISIFVLLNGGSSFLSAPVFSKVPISRRTVVAVLDIMNIFGPAGILVVLAGAFKLLAGMIERGNLDRSFFEKLFLLTWPIVGVRYVVLPDKLEYMLPLVPVSLLCFSSKRWPPMAMPILAISLIINSFVAISLFVRSDASDQLKIAPRLNEGALFQDWEQRRATGRAFDPNFMKHVAYAVYKSGMEILPQLHWKTFMWGFETADGDLVISEDQLYKFYSPRFRDDPSLNPKNYRRIFVCNKSLVPDNGGWRVLQPAPDFARFDTKSDERHFHCRLEYPPPPRVSPSPPIE
jgi:hypothetical protein